VARKLELLISNGLKKDHFSKTYKARRRHYKHAKFFSFQTFCLKFCTLCFKMANIPGVSCPPSLEKEGTRPCRGQPLQGDPGVSELPFPLASVDSKCLLSTSATFSTLLVLNLCVVVCTDKNLGI